MVNAHSNASLSPTSAPLSPEGAEIKTLETLMVFRGIFSEWGWLLLTIVLAAGAYHFTRANPWTIHRVAINTDGIQALSFQFPLLAILPILSGLKYLHAIFNERYFVCEDYVMEIRGILGWKRYSTRANYVHIRGIEIDESLVEQLFGIGDLKILTGPTGVDNYQIIMDGIVNPRRVKDLIQARTNIKLKEFHGGGAES